MKTMINEKTANKATLLTAILGSTVAMALGTASASISANPNHTMAVGNANAGASLNFGATVTGKPSVLEVEGKIAGNATIFGKKQEVASFRANAEKEPGKRKTMSYGITVLGYDVVYAKNDNGRKTEKTDSSKAKNTKKRDSKDELSMDADANPFVLAKGSKTILVGGVVPVFVSGELSVDLEGSAELTVSGDGAGLTCSVTEGITGTAKGGVGTDFAYIALRADLKLATTTLQSNLMVHFTGESAEERNERVIRRLASKLAQEKAANHSFYRWAGAPTSWVAAEARRLEGYSQNYLRYLAFRHKVGFAQRPPKITASGGLDLIQQAVNITLSLEGHIKFLFVEETVTHKLAEWGLAARTHNLLKL